MSLALDSKRFGGQFQKKPYGGRNSFSENGAPVSDLRSILAKKQNANITDLRMKLKPKALYTSKLSSRTQQPPLQGAKEAESRGAGPGGRKPLKLTTTFKNSMSSAVSGSGSSKSSRNGSSHSTPIGHRSSRSSGHKLPSYEEAKKISVTVPGLSRPVSEVRGVTGHCLVFP